MTARPGGKPPRGECPVCHRVRRLRWEGDRWVLARHGGMDTVVCDGVAEEPEPPNDTDVTHRVAPH